MTKTLAELQKDAEALGISFDGRWGVKKLQEKIKKSLADRDVGQATFSFSEVVDVVEDVLESCEDLPINKPMIKIKNLSQNKYEICGLVINSLDTVELSDIQVNDENLMKRIMRHVEIKKFKLVK